MKNYDDKLFVGSIMQRTVFEGEVVGPNITRDDIKCWLVKENAVLYKTKNGGYVDIDSLNLDGLFAPLKIRAVDKVEVETYQQDTPNGLTVMPAVSLDKVSSPTKENGHDGVLGQFVDADSLVSYVEFRNNQSKIVKTGRSK